MYRKISEKSRSWDTLRIDRFLFMAAIVLLAIFAAGGLFFRSAALPRRTELRISRHSVEIFGSDTIDALIREFEERNPELRIRVENGEDSKSPPDIIVFDESRPGAAPPQTTLSSLNPYMRTETNGERRALPLVLFMDLLFYNIDLLQAAGFDRPPKTRAEFLACARAVSSPQTGSGVYGAAISLSPDDPLALRRDLLSWIWAEDTAPGVADRAGGPRFADRTVSAVAAFLGELRREGALADGVFTTSGADRADEFARGNIAFMIASSGIIEPLRARMDAAAFGLTNIPGSSAPGRNGLGLSGIYAGISAGCALQDEAWSFLAFLAEKSPLLAATLGAVPGLISGVFPETGVFSGGATPADPLYAKAWDIFEAAETFHGLRGKPPDEEAGRAIREALRTFFEQGGRPEAVAAAIQTHWDSL